jgi:hypothetical protein
MGNVPSVPRFVVPRFVPRFVPPDLSPDFKAATHFNDPKVLLEVSEDLQGAMKGLAVAGMDEAQMLQTRGW